MCRKLITIIIIILLLLLLFCPEDSKTSRKNVLQRFKPVSLKANFWLPKPRNNPGGDYSDCGLMGYDTVHSFTWILTFPTK
jgi:hypothetical protein